MHQLNKFQPHPQAGSCTSSNLNGIKEEDKNSITCSLTFDDYNSNELNQAPLKIPILKFSSSVPQKMTVFEYTQKIQTFRERIFK